MTDNLVISDNFLVREAGLELTKRYFIGFYSMLLNAIKALQSNDSYASVC